MKKPGKPKAKRQAKYVPKERRGSNSQPSKQVQGIFALTFGGNNEELQLLNTMALAMTRLRFGVGDQDDMSLVYSRIVFGRRLAHHYGKNDLAKSLHEALQMVVRSAVAQYAIDNALPNKIGLNADEAAQASEALKRTEELTRRLTNAQYQQHSLLHRSEPPEDPIEQLQDWECVAPKLGRVSICISADGLNN